MKKLIIYITNILILSVIIFNSLQLTVYSRMKLSPPIDVVNTLNELKKISTDFNTNLTEAYNFKLTNEKPNDFSSYIDTQIDLLNNLRVSTIKNIQDPTLADYRQYYLLLSIIVGYYRLAYEQLKDYININNTEENYKTLYNIYLNISQGNITTNSLEIELSLDS